MKGYCPVCAELAPIGPTDKPIGAPGKQGSATYKVVLSHPDERLTTKQGDIVIETECKGVGRHV